MHTKVKMLTGSYILQVNTSSFNQNQISPTCLLCQKEDKNLEHFILLCESLEIIRKPILNDIQEICEGFGVSFDQNN